MSMKRGRDDDGDDGADGTVEPGAKRARDGLGERLAELGRRFRESTSAPPGEAAAAITLDDSIDPTTQEPRHDYRVPGFDGVRFVSVTEALDKLHKPFNALFFARMVAKQSAAAHAIEDPARRAEALAALKPEYRDLVTAEAVLARWREIARLGTRRHWNYYRIVTGDPPPAPPPSASHDQRLEMPPQFVAFLEDHPTLRLYRAEYKVCDTRRRLVGTIDAVFRGGILADWKTYDLDSLVPKSATTRATLRALGFEFPEPPEPPEPPKPSEPSPGPPGPPTPPVRSDPGMAHPACSHLPDVKIVKAALQLNLYRRMLHAYDPLYAAQEGEITQLWLVCVPVDLAASYFVLRLPILDETTSAILDLFPWNEHDARHLGASGFVMDHVPATLPVPGDTTVVGMRRGLALGRVAPDAPDERVWVGDAYASEYYQLPASDWAPVRKTYESSSNDERLWALRAFEAHLLSSRSLAERLVDELYGRTLVCWCPTRPREDRFCHAHVLARYANALKHGLTRLRPAGATAPAARPRQRRRPPPRRPETTKDAQ